MEEKNQIRKLGDANTHLVAHEQYPSLHHSAEALQIGEEEVEKCSIARSYRSAERIAARTPATDLAGGLPAG